MHRRLFSRNAEFLGEDIFHPTRFWPRRLRAKLRKSFVPQMIGVAPAAVVQTLCRPRTFHLNQELVALQKIFARKSPLRQGSRLATQEVQRVKGPGGVALAGAGLVEGAAGA